MKTHPGRLLAASTPIFLGATRALAQTEETSPKSIGHALLNSVVFS